MQQTGRTTTGGAGTGSIERLLRPRSVAIVGASGTPGVFGDRLLETLSGWRYGGRVYPVNPKYGCLRGHACYPSLKEIPEVPDLAVMAVADSRVEASLAEAAALGVPAAVLFGRAYETAPGDPPLLARLAAIAREAGMAVCGTNCMGFINGVDGLKVVGTPPPYDQPAPSPAKRGVALLSHSGGTWSGFLASNRDLDFAYAVSIGQEIATTLGDYIDFLVEQPEVAVIGLVMETLRDPQGFQAALAKAAQRQVPIAAVKLGRSDTSRRLAIAHSGALSGSDAAYDALFRRYGVMRCRTLDELADTLQLFALAPPPNSDAIAIVTDSGAEQQLQADLAAECGLKFATLAEATRARLVQVLDPGTAPDNPLDCYGDGTVLFEPCLKILAEDPAVGLLAAGTNLVGGRPYLAQSSEAVIAAGKATAKPVALFGNIASTVDREGARRLRAEGIPVLLGTETAIAAFAHFLAWHRPAAVAPAPVGLAPALAAWRTRLAAATGPLAPEQAFAFLADLGLPLAPWRAAEGAAAVAAAGAALGFPLVLKTARPDLLHKSEAGGVALGLADERGLLAAYAAMSVRHGPRVLLQAQVPAGMELFLGMSRDDTLGPVITLGLGGLFVEALGEVATLLPGAGQAEVMAALGALRGARAFGGFRGLPAVDRAAVAALVERFATAVAALGDLLSEIDVNPLIATPAGLVAVDALVVAAPSQGGRA